MKLETVDLGDDERQRDRLREELTLAQIDHHAEATDELDVRASWRSQNASCRAHQTCGSKRRSTCKQRLQALLFPEGIASWNQLDGWLRQLQGLRATA